MNSRGMEKPVATSAGVRRQPPGPHRRCHRRSRRFREKQRPRRLFRATGAKAGVGARHALFPKLPTLGANLAAGSPTLFSTASAVVGLAAGPSVSLRPTDSRVRPLCPLRPVVAPPGGGQGPHTLVIADARLNRFSPGRPRWLTMRWPGVTGLTSYLSGCFQLTSQRCGLSHRRRCGRFPALPGGAHPSVTLVLSRGKAWFWGPGDKLRSREPCPTC